LQSYAVASLYEDTREQPVVAEDEETKSPWWAWVLVALLVLFLLVVAYRRYPAQHPLKENPGFIDVVFANNVVLFAGRLVLLAAAVVLAFGAAYIIASMVKWMGSRMWLTRFGPFSVQDVKDLSAEVETWQELWAEADEENRELRERLQSADELLGEIHDRIQEGEEKLRALEQERPEGD
jgi:hypothetical protein